MEVSTTDFYQVIRKLSNGNEADAKTITDYIEQTKQTNYTTLKDVFMVKEDKIKIIEEIAKSKNSILLWMFGFWIGQVAVLAGILMYFLKK